MILKTNKLPNQIGCITNSFGTSTVKSGLDILYNCFSYNLNTKTHEYNYGTSFEVDGLGSTHTKYDNEMDSYNILLCVIINTSLN